MTDNERLLAEESGVIGQRGRIVGDHPWAGHRGESVRIEKTLVGYGVVVRLEDEDQECFVFDAKLWQRDQPRAPTIRLDLGPGWTTTSQPSTE